MSFEEMQDMLSEIADALPREIYRELNGGIVLSPDTKVHPKSRGDELVICGEYHYEPYGLGRYVIMYYGSLCQSYGHLPHSIQTAKLKEVLYHELTHHLENLAGDKSLERKDVADLVRYDENFLGES